MPSDSTLGLVLSLSIPHLSCIHDLLALTETSRAVRQVTLDNLTPPMLLRLANSSLQLLFSPPPPSWHLLSLIANGISLWMRESAENTRQFRLACRRAPESLVELALEHEDIPTLAHFSLEYLRQAHERRYTVINPLADLFDKCIGPQWTNQPDFWNTVQDACTLHIEHPCEPLFQLICYGELFGHGVEDWLKRHKDKAARIPEDCWWVDRAQGILSDAEWETYPGYDIGTRLEYIKHAVSDPYMDIQVRGDYRLWSSVHDMVGNGDGDDDGSSFIHPFRRMPPVGPREPEAPPRDDFATALHHLMTRSILCASVVKSFREREERALPRRLASAPDEYKSKVSEDALWTMGWDTAKILAAEWDRHPDNEHSRLRRLRRDPKDRRRDWPSMGDDGLAMSEAVGRWTKREALLEDLEEEPEAVILQFIPASRIRTADTYSLPVLVKDRHMLVL